MSAGTVSAVRPLAVDAVFGDPLVVGAQLNNATIQRMQDNYAWEQMRFRLTGTLTLAGYSTAPTKFVESIENLISSLQLSATGKGQGAANNQLCNVDAAFLYWKTAAMKGVAPYRVDVGTANGAYNFETNFTRFFKDPNNSISRFFVLNTALLNTLNVQAQWRDQTAMVTGGVAGTATLSNVQYSVTARRFLNWPQQAANPYVTETQRPFQILATAPLFPCRQIPVGQILNRQWFKALVGSTSFADPSGVLIANSSKPEGGHIQTVINNATYIQDNPAPALTADDSTEWKLSPWPVGYYEWEPARNGNIRNRPVLTNVQNADNYIDVTFQEGSLNNIVITDEQLVGVSAQQLAS
jgi:hypothetical protein